MRHCVVLVVILGLGLRRPAHDVARRVNADLRPAARARAAMSSMCARPPSMSTNVVNRKSAVLAAKSRPAGENAAFSVTGRGRCSGTGWPETFFSL